MGRWRICPHQRLGWKAPAWPSIGFHNAEGPRSSLDTIAGARAVDEMGIKHDAQDFRGSVLRGHLLTNSHLWVEPGLVGIRLKWTESRWISGEQWMASCFPFAYLTWAVGSWLALISASTTRCWEQRPASWSHQRKTWSGTGKSDTKWLKKAGEMMDPCGFPDLRNCSHELLWIPMSGKAMGVLRFLHGIWQPRDTPP